MSVFDRITEWLEKVCLAGSAVALLLMMGMTSLDVVLRKITNSSIPGLYELTEEYFMVALVFLSISHVYKQGGHVRVTLFQNMVPGFLRAPVDKLIDFLALCFFAGIGILGWKSAASALEFNELSSSILAYPIAPALFIVPMGAGLTCLRIVQSLFSFDSAKDNPDDN